MNTLSSNRCGTLGEEYKNITNVCFVNIKVQPFVSQFQLLNGLQTFKIMHGCPLGATKGAFSHSANYYDDYPGNNPENHAPAESCTINSKLKNSNI